MNWDAIGALAEAVGAVGVIGSIVYLAVQIRENTRGMRATAGFDASHSWASANDTLNQLSPSAKLATMKSYTPDVRDFEFDDVTSLELTVYHRSAFQRLEGQYYLHKFGYLDDGLWAKRRLYAGQVIRLTFYTLCWQREREMFVFSDGFAHEIEEAARCLPGSTDTTSAP